MKLIIKMKKKTTTNPFLKFFPALDILDFLNELKESMESLLVMVLFDIFNMPSQFKWFEFQKHS